jgi:cell wall-associated NlpC family hydrolase
MVADDKERGRHVGTRLAGSESRIRRGVAVAAALISVGGLVVFASRAGAAPQPTVAQVQARVNQLTSQYDKVSEQLDQVTEQLSAAHTRLAQVRVAFEHADAQYQADLTDVAQFAAASFEDTAATSVAGVLTSPNPATVLRQGSMLMEISTNRKDQTAQLQTAASELSGVEQEMLRTEDGIATLDTQLTDHKNSIGKLIATERATLDSLTVPQQQTVKSNSLGGNGSTTPTYSGPTSTQAQKAVAFAYAQLGCPYVFGGIGPCHMGYDCSGLAMAAWAAAGVSIPRDSYEQWAGLPHVSMSSVEPGDLLLFNGEGHVGIYVGNGYLIDAPVPGQVVERVPLQGWYASTLDGAVRP